MKRLTVNLLVVMGALFANFSLSGCATVRQIDVAVGDAKLAEIKNAPSLLESSMRIRELTNLYYETKRSLERDIIDGGDDLTNLGILGGIAAVANAGVGYFKVLGVGAGILGTYDVRYKPGQQRQFYLDATLALGCIAGRADKLLAETYTFKALLSINDASLRNLLATAEQVQAVNALADSVRDTYVQVLQVHRRLDEKVFSVISTQGFTTIRDNLVKNSVDAQKAAESVKAQPLTGSAKASVTTLASLAVPGVALTQEAQNRLAQIETQLGRMLADATTYKTDIAACSADFLK